MDTTTSINQLLEEILHELKRANSAERSGAVSSVKVALQRGTIDITVHAYVGSDIQEAEDQALLSYRSVMNALNQDGVDAFEKTLAAVRK
jgi:hypothetical protein